MLTHPFLKQLADNHHLCKNHLCLGLDPDFKHLPDHFPHTLNGMTEFLTSVIKETHPYCIAYKPNISFYEAFGIDGLHMLEEVRKTIPSHIPMILDAKRGDIGNTSAMQAKYIFDFFGADATTLHPYMGEDSLSPFFNYKDKYHFVLALTSNPGSQDFETLTLENKKNLYQEVVNTCQKWHQSHQNIGLVVGATEQKLHKVRQLTDLLFLIPGVGHQGGTYKDALENGTTTNQPQALIAITRDILYTSKEKDYLKKITQKIKRL